MIFLILRPLTDFSNYSSFTDVLFSLISFMFMLLSELSWELLPVVSRYFLQIFGDIDLFNITFRTYSTLWWKQASGENVDNKLDILLEN